MSKLNQIGIYDIKTGKDLGIEIIDSIRDEEFRRKYSEIYRKLEENPLELTPDEIEIIRKKSGVKNPDKVNLIYPKGYFMSSQSEELLYEKLNPLTVHVMHMCGYRMNKEGLLKYKNGKAIKNMKSLKQYFGFSDYRWNVVKSDIEKFHLIKEQPHDGINYLVVNPLYCSSQYEITMYKFMAFHKELKDSMTQLEYLYLCKKFEIIP